LGIVGHAESFAAVEEERTVAPSSVVLAVPAQQLTGAGWEQSVYISSGNTRSQVQGETYDPTRL
jgi:hypothetical protein